MSSKRTISIPGLGSVPPNDKLSSIKKTYLSNIVSVHKTHLELFNKAVECLGLGSFEVQAMLRLRTDLVTLESIFIFVDVVNRIMSGAKIDQDYLSSCPLLSKKKNLVNSILSKEAHLSDALKALGIDIGDLEKVSITTALNFYTLDQLAIISCLLGIDFPAPTQLTY